MRVKLGVTWYDSEDVPLCVELAAEDRQRIADMAPGATRYAAFPDDCPPALIEAWMKDRDPPTRQ